VLTNVIDETSIDTGEFPAFKKTRPESISTRTIVDFGAVSHPGRIRVSNQDSFLVTHLRRSMQTLLTNLPADGVTDLHTETAYGMLVADGVGGAAGGDVASRTAISALVDLAIQTPDWILKLDEVRAGQVMQRMKDRFDRLREALEECVLTDPDLNGLGTTMTLAVSLGADLVIAHVGDSRAYLFTEGQLVRLTTDQTMAQLLTDLGVISPAETDTHHARHVLTGVIAADGEKAEVELHHVRLADGDQLLLCTDGLTDMISDLEIAAVLETRKPAAESCAALVDLAIRAGGKDNVTVILAGYQIPSS